MCTAACLTGHISKFGHVIDFMCDVLHWVPIKQRIVYRLAALVWRCLLGLAPTYLQLSGIGFTAGVPIFRQVPEPSTAS